MVNSKGFDSVFEKVKVIQLPEYADVRVMMLPVIIGDATSLPDFIAGYKQAFRQMCEVAQAAKHAGSVGYLTVDEKTVKADGTHRRGGLHVDGIYQGSAGAWGGGSRPPGTWGAVGNGMLTVANPAGCRAYLQWFDGWPGYEGECDHLANQCNLDSSVLFAPNTLYWVDGLCVHESVPMSADTPRQFVRLSLPSNGPWFEGYTENPLGVKPTGEILPEREFMKI